MQRRTSTPSLLRKSVIRSERPGEFKPTLQAHPYSTLKRRRVTIGFGIGSSRSSSAPPVAALVPINRSHHMKQNLSTPSHDNATIRDLPSIEHQRIMKRSVSLHEKLLMETEYDQTRHSKTALHRSISTSCFDGGRQYSTSERKVRRSSMRSVKEEGNVSIRSLTAQPRKRYKPKKIGNNIPVPCNNNEYPEKQQAEVKNGRCCGFAVWILLVSVIVLAGGYGVTQRLNATYSAVIIINTTMLAEVFNNSVFGQNLVNQVVPSIISDYISNDDDKPLVLSFHGWTGTGKTLVTTLLIEELFKKQKLDECAHRFVSSLDFRHEDQFDVYNTHIVQVINSTKRCKIRLLVFDEIDIMPYSLVPKLLGLFSDNSHLAQVGKSICILESNLYGLEINQYMVQNYFTRSLVDSAVSVSDFQEYLKDNTLSDTKMTVYGPDDDIFNSGKALMWYSILQPVIDNIVLFVPLTRKHVRQCIMKDLQDKGILPGDNIIDNIVDQMHYFPTEEKLFSVSGCKRISAKVDAFL